MKFIVTVLILVLITSCSQDNRLCECVSAGDEVNELSAAFFDGSNPASRRDSLKKAKKIRDSICKPYIKMGPEELHKAAKNCESLTIDSELE